MRLKTIEERGGSPMSQFREQKTLVQRARKVTLFSSLSQIVLVNMLSQDC